MTPYEGKILADITNRIAGISTCELDNHANTIEWGTFGPDGDKPMRVRVLNDLETGHLENILITQKQISFLTAKVILHILKARYREIYKS